MKTDTSKPLGVVEVHDNGGKTIDRYTVYYRRRYFSANAWQHGYMAMSAAPFHPQGFGQHGEGTLGRHNGRRIAFRDLPVDCRKLVMQDLGCKF